jgi:hypothetical protein
MALDLDDLRERIVVSLAGTAAPMLRPLADQALYVVAVTTDSDCITLRLLAHTEEALDLLTGGEDDPDTRWWPDEWEVADDDVVPDHGAESTSEISRTLFGTLDDDDPTWPDRARDLFDSALGDARVREAIAGVNPTWQPVMFVTDTDGDLARTVVSLESLNRDHPNPDLVAAAVAYFGGSSADGT